MIAEMLQPARVDPVRPGGWRVFLLTRGRLAAPRLGSPGGQRHRLRWPFALLFGFFLALQGSPVRAETDWVEWLRAMNRAFTELDYDGIVTHYSGGELATLRIVHMVIDGEQRERLVHLNGAPRQIVRRGREVVCMVAPDDVLLALGADMPAGPFAGIHVADAARIAENYRVVAGGDDRVAGRAAVRLLLEPGDEHRYGYRLWLDSATRLLLRSELIDASGERLEMFQFNQLVVGPDVDPAALEPDDADGALVSELRLSHASEEATSTGPLGWRASWLPVGFDLAVAEASATSGRPMERMLFSDGLAAFSIFIESESVGEVTPVESQEGATIVVTRPAPISSDEAAQTQTQRQLITVVGEIPPPTARRIAAAVQRMPAAAP